MKYFELNCTVIKFMYTFMKICDTCRVTDCFSFNDCVFKYSVLFLEDVLIFHHPPA